jgi:hypothetical protein
MSRRFIALLLAAAAAVGFVWGDDVRPEVHVDLYQNLLTCSAIVFGVMGAWIAIIYPRTMEQVTDDKTLDPLEEASIYASLRPAMYTSTLVLAVVLFAAPIAAMLVEQEFYSRVEPWALKASMVCLLSLTGVQLYALLTSLAPFVITNDAITVEAKRQDAIATVERRKR